MRALFVAALAFLLARALEKELKAAKVPMSSAGVPRNTFEKTVPSFCFKNVVPKFRNTKIMSNQVYYVLARVGADSIGLYVESPDFDSA